MRAPLLICSLAAVVAACGSESFASANAGATAQAASSAGQAAQGAAPSSLPFQTEVMADLESPWAMTFLPDGRALVTEKGGKMLLWSRGRPTLEVAGIPAVDTAGQGGLMDVVLAPGFPQNRLVYFSFSEAGEGGKGVALARGRLVEQGGAARLDGVSVIFRATPYLQGNGHYSGRIAFSPNGRHLFFTNGERMQFDPAQDPKSTLGKVLRLNLDGTPAAGNPLVARGFHPAIWSFGHRNLLGLAFDARGNLWEHEHGPRGGDEVNLVLPARNYGYPNASNGDHYPGAPKNGADIPDHRPGDGYEAPKVTWTPVIGPGGMMIYSGSMFPQWRGDAFIGGMTTKSLVRVDLNGTNARKGDDWPMGERIREVEQGPDGAIWVLEDGLRGGKGRMLRLTPATQTRR